MKVNLEKTLENIDFLNGLSLHQTLYLLDILMFICDFPEFLFSGDKICRIDPRFSDKTGEYSTLQAMGVCYRAICHSRKRQNSEIFRGELREND